MRGSVRVRVCTSVAHCAQACTYNKEKIRRTNMVSTLHLRCAPCDIYTYLLNKGAAQMLLIDDIVYDEEVWEWFHKKQKEHLTNYENTQSVYVFYELLYEDEMQGACAYKDLTCAEFFNLLDKLFYIFSGVGKGNMFIPTRYTLEEIQMEMRAIEKTLVFWACTCAHEPERLGDLDLRYLGTKMVNHRFQTHTYYMYQQCVQGLEQLHIRIEDYDVVPAPDDDEVEEPYDKLRAIITKAYGGDLDEFILDCIEDFQFTNMTPWHEKLAIVRGYELMGVFDWKTGVPHHERWRRIFTKYFSEEEDSFRRFIRVYTGMCVSFFFRNYLCQEPPFLYISAYGVYIRPGESDACRSCLGFIDFDAIEARIKELY